VRQITEAIPALKTVWAATVLPERYQATTAGFDETVRLWDLAAGREVQSFEGHTDCVRTLAAPHHRNQALSAGDDGTVRLWDLGGRRSGLQA
jgi:WD40 repeat protein